MAAPFAQWVSGPATSFLQSSPMSREIGLTPFDDFDPEMKAAYDKIEDPTGQKIVFTIRALRLYEQQRKIPVQDQMDLTNQLYNNFYPKDTEKMSWQSKSRFPGMFIAAERISRQMVKLMDASPDWLKIEATNPDNQVYYDLAKDLILYDLKQAKFRKVLGLAFKDMLINTFGNLMVTYNVKKIPQMQQEDTLASVSSDDVLSEATGFLSKTSDDDEDTPFIPNPDKSHLCLELIDPNWMYLDSSGRNRYKIWWSELTVGELLYSAEARGYDKEACIRSIGKQYMDSYNSEMRNAFNRGVRPAPQDENYSHLKIRLCHFEGTLYHPDTGELLFEDKYCVVSNDAELVLEPIPIPFWDKESAIVSAPFIDIARNIYGKSLLGENNDAFMVQHNLMNLLLDFFQLSLVNGYQMDVDSIDEEDQMQRNASIFPGMLVRYHGMSNPSGKPVIMPIINTDLPPGFWNFLQMFKTENDENTGLSQEMQGSSGIRRRQTAGESQANQAASSTVIEGVFNDLEDNFIAPAIRLCWLRSLQYRPDVEWRSLVLTRMYKLIPTGPNVPQQQKDDYKAKLLAAAKWDNKTRFKKLGADMSFDVKIYGSLLDRQGEIEKITYTMSALAKFPQASQETNLRVLLKKQFEAFGWDADELLNDNPAPTTGDPITNVGQLDGTWPAPPDLSQGALGGASSAMNAATGGPFPGGPTSPVPGMPTPPPGQ